MQNGPGHEMWPAAAVPPLPMPQDDEAVVRMGSLELPAAAAHRMSDAAIVTLLVQNGVSRVSAHRIVEVERGGSAASRARSHSRSRL